MHAYDRKWLAASPFCLVATAGADGTCDVSPKGDPAGFTLVLDDTTIAIPERPGNRRADGFHNVLDNPHVGLIFLLPGRGDTLRINGRAAVVREARRSSTDGREGAPAGAGLGRGDRAGVPPLLEGVPASALWKPETWRPDAAPSRPEIAKAMERPDDDMAELERYYGPAYEKTIYG